MKCFQKATRAVAASALMLFGMFWGPQAVSAQCAAPPDATALAAAQLLKEAGANSAKYNGLIKIASPVVRPDICIRILSFVSREVPLPMTAALKRLRSPGPMIDYVVDRNHFAYAVTSSEKKDETHFFIQASPERESVEKKKPGFVFLGSGGAPELALALDVYDNVPEESLEQPAEIMVVRDLLLGASLLVLPQRDSSKVSILAAGRVKAFKKGALITLERALNELANQRRLLLSGPAAKLSDSDQDEVKKQFSLIDSKQNQSVPDPPPPPEPDVQMP